MPNKILIIGFVGLGDLLLFEPTLRAMRKGTDASIEIVLPANGSRDLVEMMGLVDRIEVASVLRGHVGSSINNVLRQIHWLTKFGMFARTQAYGISIWPYASTTWKKECLSYLFGAKRRYLHERCSVKNKGLRYLNTLLPGVPNMHVAEKNLLFLDALGLQRPRDMTPKLPTRAEDRRAAEDYLRPYRSGRRIIGFHPGGNLFWNKYRCWGFDKYARLADLLIAQFECHVLLFGTGSESLLLESIHSSVKQPEHVTLVCNRSLPEVAAIIQQLDLFVGNNSALMHIAAAVGTTVVAVFGPTDPTNSGPIGRDAWIVRLDLPCSPCFELPESRHASVCINKRAHACLTELQPDAVLSVAAEALQKETQHHGDGQAHTRVISVPCAFNDLNSVWNTDRVRDSASGAVRD